jgi:hypothetical protein
LKAGAFLGKAHKEANFVPKRGGGLRCTYAGQIEAFKIDAIRVQQSYSTKKSNLDGLQVHTYNIYLSKNCRR